MILSRIFGYGLLLSLLANVGLYALWQHARASAEAGKAAQAKADNIELQRVIAQREAAQRKADALAKRPAKVVTLVRENPSHCDLPQPVADGLREQVREVNEAIRVP